MSAPKSVTGRVFALLSVFTEARTSANVSELSRHAGLPLSTTHRLATELTAWGALDRAEDGRYRIGLRIWELGALYPGSLTLRDRALPFLEDLWEVTRHNVQLAIRDRLEAVYVERLSAKDAVNVVTRMGSRLPLHATGVGLVLLSPTPRWTCKRRHCGAPSAPSRPARSPAPNSCGPCSPRCGATTTRSATGRSS